MFKPGTIVAMVILLLTPAMAASNGQASFPIQLEMRVPFPPTSFPGAGHANLIYELYLTNFQAKLVSLAKIEVRDGDNLNAAPVAIFEEAQLDSMIKAIGAQSSDTIQGHRQIAPGGSLIVFVMIALDPRQHMPDRIVHRVILTDGTLDGAPATTHTMPLHVLGSPLQGPNWVAEDGPGNEPDNHHRRGLFVNDGRVTISPRYAIDWQQKENGAFFSGNARDVRSYYSYGKPVLAVANATVIAARDGLPDNIPGHNENFHPTVPITMDTVAGNTVTLDLGGGQYAYYMHLKPGSVSVKIGDRVRRGQVIAQVGGSGDAREPHLHFEVTTARIVILGEGVPYTIDSYRIVAPDGSREPVARALPMNNSVVDFGGEPAAGPP